MLNTFEVDQRLYLKLEDAFCKNFFGQIVLDCFFEMILHVLCVWSVPDSVFVTKGNEIGCKMNLIA